MENVWKIMKSRQLKVLLFDGYDLTPRRVNLFLLDLAINSRDGVSPRSSACCLSLEPVLP